MLRRVILPASLPDISAPRAGFEASFDRLAACHERVARTLVLLARLQQHLLEQGQEEAAQQAAPYVMRCFDLAAPLHQQIEELLVFPLLLAVTDVALVALEQRPLQDHREMEVAWPLARKVLLGIAVSPAPEWAPLAPGQTLTLNGFATLYARHMKEEDHPVYSKAHAALTGDALQINSLDMVKRRVTPRAT